MKELIDFDGAPVFGIPLADGSGVHEGMLVEGPQGWGEFSPPPGCDDAEAGRWLTAAIEGGTVGWPDAVRGRIPIAVGVPAVDPAAARAQVVASGCRTADVTVTADPDSLADDVTRVGSVRDALGASGRIRLTINDIRDVPAVLTTIAASTAAAGVIEFVGLRGTAEELSAVRRGVDVPIAVDVRSAAAAADVAVVRTGPAGGVRRGLRLAEQCGLPCVVSAAGETSVGLASGLALAGALADLPFACALGATVAAGDVVADRRSLVPVDGYLPVAPSAAAPERALVARYALVDPDRIAWWRARLQAARRAV